MKHKILFIFTIASILSTHVVAQDTSTQRPALNDQTYPINTTKNTYNSSQHQIYRDTRLGSSSANYNTYEKNDNGAGAITTDPHKAAGSSSFSEMQPDSSVEHTPKIYRDTRLGSSSAPYNTYQKNDEGAGAITTNPHK
jgi:uncharacterized protein (DUF2461 family)